MTAHHPKSIHMCRLAFFFALVIMPAASFSDEIPLADSGNALVAVLPFANYSGDGAAVEVFTPLIAQQLDQLGISVTDAGLTRQTLRRHRIRAVGAIDRAGADALARDLGVGYLLTGSIDLFVTGSVPETGLSVRLVDPRSLRVVWARSVGAAATDFGTAFGLGQIGSMAGLTKRVAAAALAGLDEDLIGGFAAREPEDMDVNRLAVVTFDDLVPASHAGRVISAHVLSQLVGRGYHLVEPGVAGELFLAFQRVPRGGIDYELLSALHDSLGVTAVLTGVVDPFLLGSPGAESSFPTVGISARVIDAESGRIRRVADVSRDGGREIVFGIGSVRSGAKLVRAATGALLDRLELKEKGSVALR
jgi:TolB-like protein